MDWMLDAGIEICNTLARLEANGRDLSATECKNIIAKHYAAQQSVQPTLLQSPRHGSHSCECGLCKGTNTTLPQSG